VENTKVLQPLYMRKREKRIYQGELKEMKQQVPQPMKFNESLVFQKAIEKSTSRNQS